MRTALITILRKGERISFPFGDPGETTKEFKKLCGELEQNPAGVTEACLWVSDVGISKRRRFAQSPAEQNSTVLPGKGVLTHAAPEETPVSPAGDDTATTHATPSQEGPAGEQSPAGDADGGDDSLSLLPGSAKKKKP